MSRRAVAEFSGLWPVSRPNHSRWTAAAKLEFELVSMDDAHVFGPEFHVLTFHEAISAKPEPLLTDDQVVVIRLRRTAKPKRGPSESAEGGLVRTSLDREHG